MSLRKLILPRWGALGREARDTARLPEKRRAHLVRLIRWSPVFVAVTLFALWVVIYSKWNLRDNPVASCMAIGYLLFICAGSYWMFYDCWHHDKRFTRKNRRMLRQSAQSFIGRCGGRSHNRSRKNHLHCAWHGRSCRPQHGDGRRFQDHRAHTVSRFTGMARRVRLTSALKYLSICYRATRADANPLTFL